MPRPKSIEISHWDKKYYSLDPEQDKKAVLKLKEQRLTKAYTNVYILAHGKEPGRVENRTINKAINAIIERI